MNNLQIAEQYASMNALILQPGGQWLSDISNAPVADRADIIAIYKKHFDTVNVDGTSVQCLKAKD